MSNIASSFDLPVDEITSYINDLMEQIGESAIVDGVQTKMMIADLDRIVTNLQQNMKQTVFFHDISVQRGSRIELSDGRIAMVYTVPNDDIVNKSAQIILFNSSPLLNRYEEVFDNSPNSKTYGDVISQQLVNKGNCAGFIERITSKEKQFDVGLLHDAILRFFTFRGVDIALDDIFIFNNKHYRVIDTDDITDGVLVVQLAFVRI